MWRSGRSRGRAKLGMAGAWDLRWRKFRPHQCPKCKHRSKETIVIDSSQGPIPRYCTQTKSMPFLSEDTKRDCKFFEEGNP